MSTDQQRTKRQSIITRKPVGGVSPVSPLRQSAELGSNVDSEGVSFIDEELADPHQVKPVSSHHQIDALSLDHGQSTPLVYDETANATKNDGRTRKEEYYTSSEKVHEDRSLSRETWLPMSLKWGYMTALSCLMVCLGLIVLVLWTFSDRNDGLGPVKDSSSFTFGWRFTPTLIAVMASLLLKAVVDDVQRTEPYARLSRPEGASARLTIFYKAGYFLLDPFVSMSKDKNGGRRNWALFWVSIANIITILIISPFSAALLSPSDVITSASTIFSRVTVPSDNMLNLASVDDSILFRTISSVLLNTTTSAWITNKFTVLPFWSPREDPMPIGATLTNSNIQWSSKTTVFQLELECQTMELQKMSNWTTNFMYDDSGHNNEAVKVNVTSFVLRSTDGCSLGFGTTALSLQTGVGLWSRPPDFEYPLIGNNVVDGEVRFNSSTPVLLNSSTECGGRDVIFYTTPYVYGEEFSARGHVCDTKYYAATVEATARKSIGSSMVNFDVTEFNRSKILFDFKTLNISAFEDNFLSQNWSSKFQEPTLTNRPLARLGGPLILVGAQNDYDLAWMTKNADIVEQARMVKQRFFGESILPIFAQMSAESTLGTIAVNEWRIVANFTISVILIVSFSLVAISICMAMFATRLHRRPLGVSRDPASTMGLASLIISESSTRLAFDGMDQSSEKVMMEQLENISFHLKNGRLYVHDARVASEEEVSQGYQQKSSDWRPAVMRGWLLVLLFFWLLALATILIVLFVLFHESGIYQHFLASNLNIKVNSQLAQGLAPYSIIPTVIAIVVKLWWESIDVIFRRLQPFTSMIRQATELSAGANLSYMTTPVGWIVWRAAKYRHWPLILVAIGAVLVQIFTVSMSALWDLNPGARTHQSTFARNMEFRTTPSIITYSMAGVGRAGASGTSTSDKLFRSILSNNIGNILTSWLYAGIVEGTFNASAAPWMNEEWIFAPINTSLPGDGTAQAGLKNVTLKTPALRARLECTPIDMTNSSEWLKTHSFTNRTLWNDPKIPAGLDVGYELKNSFYVDRSKSNSSSFLPDGNRLTCCANETTSGVQRASVGYWTEITYKGGIIIKWVTGRPFSHQFQNSKPDYGNTNGYYIWKDVPKVTAIKCTPLFESGNAEVKVDAQSGIVHEHRIIDLPVIDQNALQYKYVELNVSKGLSWSQSPTGRGSGYLPPGGKDGEFLRNVTVSYGHLFIDAILSAANIQPIPDEFASRDEKLTDRNFNFRLPGLNVDFMSYNAFSLAGNDPDALSDPDTLANISSRTFSTFFKHFAQAGKGDVANGLYLDGTWGIQPLHATIPEDLGPTASYSFGPPAVYLQNTSVPSNISGEVIGMVDVPVERLILSPTAVFLSIAILGILAITTVVVLGWHRQPLRLLPRDVDTIASVLGLVYASDRLLDVARREVEGDMADEKEIGKKMAGIGWFESGGKQRWGVEIVDDDDGSGEGMLQEQTEGAR